MLVADSTKKGTMLGKTVGAGAVLKFPPQLVGTAVSLISPLIPATALVGLGISIAAAVQKLPVARSNAPAVTVRYVAVTPPVNAPPANAK